MFESYVGWPESTMRKAATVDESPTVDKATLAIARSVVRAEINDGVVYDRIGLLGGEPIRT
jgi:hypothetical protein